MLTALHPELLSDMNSNTNEVEGTSLSRKLGLKFNLEANDMAEMNMDVINPEGKLMFIRR